MTLVVIVAVWMGLGAAGVWAADWVEANLCRELRLRWRHRRMNVSAFEEHGRSFVVGAIWLFAPIAGTACLVEAFCVHKLNAWCAEKAVFQAGARRRARARRERREAGR